MLRPTAATIKQEHNPHPADMLSNSSLESPVRKRKRYSRQNAQIFRHAMDSSLGATSPVPGDFQTLLNFSRQLYSDFFNVPCEQETRKKLDAMIVSLQKCHKELLSSTIPWGTDVGLVEKGLRKSQRIVIRLKNLFGRDNLLQEQNISPGLQSWHLRWQQCVLLTMVYLTKKQPITSGFLKAVFKDSRELKKLAGYAVNKLRSNNIQGVTVTCFPDWKTVTSHWRLSEIHGILRALDERQRILVHYHLLNLFLHADKNEKLGIWAVPKTLVKWEDVELLVTGRKMLGCVNSLASRLSPEASKGSQHSIPSSSGYLKRVIELLRSFFLNTINSIPASGYDPGTIDRVRKTFFALNFIETSFGSEAFIQVWEGRRTHSSFYDIWKVLKASFEAEGAYLLAFEFLQYNGSRSKKINPQEYTIFLNYFHDFISTSSKFQTLYELTMEENGKEAAWLKGQQWLKLFYQFQSQRVEHLAQGLAEESNESSIDK